MREILLTKDGIVFHECMNDIKEVDKYLGPRPSLDHSIDRVDNDGPYCICSIQGCRLGNLRWATATEQANNKECTRGHGTVSMYVYRKCRCIECCLAKSVYAKSKREDKSWKK